MGNCLSCLKSSPPSQQIDFNPQPCHHIHHSNFMNTSLQISGYEKDLDGNGSNLNSTDGFKSTAHPMDTRSIGSGKNSTISNMHEKWSFCSRIPPLAKSASSEVRRLSSKEYSETKINNLFDSYKDPHYELMLSEGIERLCSELDVKPDDFRILLLAWKFNAGSMCHFTRQEFVNGCIVLKVDTVKGLQSKLCDLVSEVQDTEKFKDLYRFTYRFGLDKECCQTVLPSDMAILLWKLVFIQNEPPILSRWLSFLEQHPNIRGIPRDTWNMFLNFVEVIGDDLSLYDDSEAWPSLLDDFVEYENDNLNQNISKDHKDEQY